MERIKRIAGLAFKYGAIAWFAAAIVWCIIVSTLRNGISCDEGYYLMGYLRGQNIEGIGTDFHAIVRFLCNAFNDEDIMVFRYTRLILNVIALVFFTLTSYEWLSRTKLLNYSRWAYYPMILLSGAMSFTFAAPTISYDSLEVGFILLAISFLFIILYTKKKSIANLSSIFLGFFIWFACSNYPPAGVFITILIVLFYFIEQQKTSSIHFLFAFLGVVIAIVISHFFIHDMKDWFSEMSRVFVSTFTEESKSRHDAGSLVSVMLSTIGKEVLIFVPIVAICAILYRKIKASDIFLWIFTFFACIILIVFRKAYDLRSTILLAPVAILLGKLLAKEELDTTKFFISKEFLCILIMIAMPVFAVFGTNQPIMKKAVIYAPIWALAFFYISAVLNKSSDNRLLLLLTTILFAGYVWLGNFQRYHCYYTPRSSHYEIIGASRPQKVQISQYQQQYYGDLLDSLKSSGCKPGDMFMAFGENQMAVFLAGGFINGRLPYHWWQYKHFEKTAPQAFVLFKNEERDVIEYFKQANWDFPDNYKRIEMRQMSQNMGDDYRTVIYVSNDL